LLTVALLVGLAVGCLVLVGRLKSYPLPGNQQGYEPEQPIAFSHRQHAGDLQVSCVYCHFGAETSEHAGIPPAQVCMTCHRFVTAPQSTLLPEALAARRERRAPRPIVSAELQKLYDSLTLDGKLEPDPNKRPQPIAWVKVHNLPSFTCFNHSAHRHAGITCQQCHGPIETMDRVRQVADLSMGWCVNCHRENGRTGASGKNIQSSTDCATCHH
jgi:hypothetical protein